MPRLFNMSRLIVRVLVVCLLATSPLLALAYTPQAMYDDVWRLVQAKHLDNTKNGQAWGIWRHRFDADIDTEEDAYVAIATMLASLNDRYTRFLTPKEFEEEGQSIQATLFGIGIQIGVRDNKLVVIAPMEDTPADRAGLKPNDEIVEIDGHPTQGMDVREAADLIRGEKGSKVKLLVRRDNAAPKVMLVTRDEIKLKSVSAKHPMGLTTPKNVAYIRLSTFLSALAANEVKALLEKNTDKDGFILDLRSNPGGLLKNAITIADFFLAEGPIVSTVDRDGYKERVMATGHQLTNKPLVVLIDEGSASASEILSGALSDHRRAMLVGKRTFGKGLVQEINQLPRGAGINITTQKYLTPNGTDINKKGIEPDVVVALTEDDIKAKRDPQFAKAVAVLQAELAKGKVATK
jgi:carboxyl-terminal processing protease